MSHPQPLDPWELADDLPRAWRLEIEGRSQALTPQMNRDARWALFAVGWFIDRVHWAPTARSLQEVGLWGSLTNGIWLSQIDLAAILLPSESNIDLVTWELEQIAGAVSRGTGLPIVVTTLSAAATTLQQATAQWAAIQMDYVILWRAGSNPRPRR